MGPEITSTHSIRPREKRNERESDVGCAPAALKEIKYRHYLFSAFIALSVVAFWRLLKELVHTALHLDFCSQVLVIPFATLLLVYWNRKKIFGQIKSGPALGGMVFLVGIVVYWLGRHEALFLGPYDSLSLATSGIVLVWIAGFSLVYGPAACRAAVYPIGFLFLTVPIPSHLLNWSVFCLQSGSTAVAKGLFEIFGVPVMRHGFILSLPGLTIEVAKECSSIRSSIALVISCLIAGYLFLRSAWKRAALVLIALPLSLLKNGIRIVTLSLLSIYVNPAFMKSDLHRDGGVLFYLLALAILFPLFRWFEKSDLRDQAG